MSVTFFPKRGIPIAWRRMAKPTWSFAARAYPAAPRDVPALTTLAGAPYVPAAPLSARVDAAGADWLEHHGSRVAWISERIALAMGLSPTAATSIAAAARMHDMGKRLLPHEVIDRPGQLTPADWGWIRKHPELGASAVLATSGLAGDDLETAVAVALLHHERWDGRGYPCGLHGEAIPLAARIVAVADVFDALISERPYKQAWPDDEAFDYVLAASGTQFDPTCVAAFTRVYVALAAGWRRRAEGRAERAAVGSALLVLDELLPA